MLALLAYAPDAVVRALDAPALARLFAAAGLRAGPAGVAPAFFRRHGHADRQVAHAPGRAAWPGPVVAERRRVAAAGAGAGASAMGRAAAHARGAHARHPAGRGYLAVHGQRGFPRCAGPAGVALAGGPGGGGRLHRQAAGRPAGADRVRRRRLPAGAADARPRRAAPAAAAHGGGHGRTQHRAGRRHRPGHPHAGPRRGARQDTDPADRRQ
ncbi:Uncharacterised protein [Bordetella pertussis]|nr:Uncharacterised protein [Bordetella pertussis]